MKFSIDFGSAISPNRLEEVNIIEARANVCHTGLQKVMKRIHPKSIGFIGAANIGNIFESGPPWTNFDLGITEDSYNETIDRMKNTIERNVFKFFDQYSEIKNILKYYKRPCFNLRCTIQLYLYLNEHNTLKELISMIISERKESFVSVCESFNRRFNNGEKWIDIYKDVNDGEDSLALEIAQSFSEMGETYDSKNYR